MNQSHQPPWLVNNILICYEGDKHTEKESEIKQHFLQQGKHSNSKETHTDGSKSTRRKVGYAAVFAGTTGRGVLSEEGHYQKKPPFTQLKCQQ